MNDFNPKATLDSQRFMDYEKSVIGSWRVEEVSKLIDRKGMSVLDIGGASGVFLNEVN